MCVTRVCVRLKGCVLRFRGARFLLHSLLVGAAMYMLLGVAFGVATQKGVGVYATWLARRHVAHGARGGAAPLTH